MCHIQAFHSESGAPSDTAGTVLHPDQHWQNKNAPNQIFGI